MLRLIPNQAASDIKTPGKYTENITVTYPDGSQDNIDTNVFADEKPKTTTIEAPSARIQMHLRLLTRLTLQLI
ncbi:Rib/alpha-like domain-containing protein [uncultured Lactobacillus sp.]|uniref:Rib/alpha-like domain-containing protein n=1 Tax=uncultured Lactobacillus sp. TaxID=153152 RepID=UPI00261D25D0|nr:Rib/alpha-like domain-containing protein [uncultured Lactobacillus sp.]